ncbi:MULTISPECIES: UDP-N-acetyl-D-mannosamine dehydrogenase [Chromohalobacter]|uniref:UDP-N-acetyl-D-mannosamine dehydrogenase n=1 Tax=Chromohalobacter moromii TaxID=2860329 RepID=A0A9X2WZB7_9GAMM|nr:MULTISPECIES: UDP-N-acetyl-D-mannosamine dehydrogenase [Chromohalobacter]MCK2045075.1 UDP-N-acetyl-D-mannosamine dehydrogenase [Chromohalobacter moromii]MCT8468062.1 UDP-N-acetyl-D-mannosamine dehydrogenase [Chromohalobacter canadensis]MCT8498559.1 UDP-N-acetyl-D-mannosamine dehydrogenase [Chromohalobacter canadensis]MCT8503776.1 UDP-N-acetyl-D-mannosamine dehydrogenase [Chromohalobacter moromii]
MEFNTVSVVGLGYIGLPTAAVIASRKKKVIGIDVNQHAVDTINGGRIHIVEPELDMLVHAAVKERYLRATTVPEPADVFLIAVPTPFKTDPEEVSFEPDLSYIEAACKSIAPVLKKGDLVILESTSPVGTTEKMARWLSKERSDLSFPQTQGENSDIRIAYCPERVLPGHIIRELIENDRIIGGLTKQCSLAASSFYKLFVNGECIVSDARTAEMAKLTENSFRDVNIAFANELSLICDKFDIDVSQLIRLANRHPRVNILKPGPGVGGHCIAVDPWFIISEAPDESKLIKAAREVNKNKPDWVLKKVQSVMFDLASTYGLKVTDITFGCFGLSFKPNIDDLRESPAYYVVSELSKLYPKQVVAVEPNVSKLRDESINLASIKEALGCDILIFLVDHDEFKELELPEEKKAVIDFRG